MKTNDEQKIIDRASDLLRSQQEIVLRRYSRVFAGLMALEFAAGVACALWLTPRAWDGLASQIHPHVWQSLVIGFVLTSLPVFLAVHSPLATITRHVIAAGQMLMAGLLIHLTGGRLETHFLIFGSLAFLSFYSDWKILLTASLVTAIDHFWRGAVWQQSIYGAARGVRNGAGSNIRDGWVLKIYSWSSLASVSETTCIWNAPVRPSWKMKFGCSRKRRPRWRARKRGINSLPTPCRNSSGLPGPMAAWIITMCAGRIIRE